MEEVAVVGIDLAKAVFQVHGIDGRSQVVLRQQLSRSKLLGFFAKLTVALANKMARIL